MSERIRLSPEGRFRVVVVGRGTTNFRTEAAARGFFSWAVDQGCARVRLWGPDGLIEESCAA